MRKLQCLVTCRGVDGLLMRIVVVGFAVCAHLRMEAQQTPSAPEPPPATLHSRVSMVALDITIDDLKGAPLRGLRASNFHVREDGRPQQVLYLERHRRSDSDAATLPFATANDPNTFNDVPRSGGESSPVILVLDALDSPDLTASLYLRQQLIAYMKQVPVGTQIAIVQMDRSLHLLQGFSGDPVELERALLSPQSAARVSPLVENPCTLPSQMAGTGPATAVTGGVAFTESSAQDMLTALCQRADLASVYGQVADEERSQILSRCLPQIMALANSAEGRKSIVWFYSQTPATEVIGKSLKASMDADENALSSGMRKVMDTFKPTNISLTFVDIGAHMGVNETDAYLARVAERNGIESFAGTNGIMDVLQHEVGNAWEYYTAYYQPTDRTFDGHYRNISVRVDQPHGYLQYRRGYYADGRLSEGVPKDGRRWLPLDLSGPGKPKDSPLQTAMLLGSQPPDEVLFQVRVTKAAASAANAKEAHATSFIASRYKREKVAVMQLSCTFDANSMTFQQASPGRFVAHAAVVVIGYDDVGTVLSTIRSDITIRADQRLLTEMQRTGIPFEQTFAFPAKSSKFLRIGVEDKGSGDVGAIEMPMDLKVARGN